MTTYETREYADGEHPPVEDWQHDFDHSDPVWAADPYPIWEEIRSSGCPVAHSNRYGGVWMPTSHETVSQVAYDTEHFTSRTVVVTHHRPPDIAPIGIAPPITSDPPFHHGVRRLILPAFAPQAIDKLEPSTREYCQQLIDDMGGRTEVDAAVEYAQHIPVRVIAHMLGFPPEDGDKFRQFVDHALKDIALPLEQRVVGMQALFEYLLAQIQDHQANPRDDLTSYLLDAELNGQPVDPGMVGGMIALLLIAGIDTTWSAIGASIWHLAGHPKDRERLVAEPELLPTAMEEFLRAYAPVTMARLVKEDVEWNGCPMKKDDWVLLPFPAANRDPEMYENPDEVVIDREVNRHSAFGLGIHRCAGSHLARMELRVALEVWLENFPTFSLTDPDKVLWSGGQVRGPRILPITIG